MMRALLIVCGYLLSSGCGSDLGDKERGEACTRDAECEEGLTCEGGVCDSRLQDAGEEDAATDAP